MIKVDYNVAEFCGYKLKFDSEILSYIEMSDRVIFLLNWYKLDFDESDRHPVDATQEDEENENIQCFSLETGKLLWKIKEVTAATRSGLTAFCGLGVVIEPGKEGTEWYSSTFNKEIIVKNFDLDKSLLRSNTLDGSSYTIDPKTGEYTFISQGK